VEESGVKWGMERFFRGLRNPAADKPSIPNLISCIWGALYTKIDGLSSPKSPPKNVGKITKTL